MTAPEPRRLRPSDLSVIEGGKGATLSQDVQDQGALDGRDVAAEVERINDARVRGDEPLDVVAFLDRRRAFMMQAYKQAPWSKTTRSWRQMIEESGWGMTAHVERRKKDGAAVVLGEGTGAKRSKLTMRSAHALWLDVDTGIPMDVGVQWALDRGVLAVFWTTHSHMTGESSAKYDDVVKGLAPGAEPTTADLRSYLARTKDGLSAAFLESVEITDPKDDSEGAWLVRYRHDPIPKWRGVFPLKDSLRYLDFTSQAEGHAYLKGKLRGLAHAVGVVADDSATDPSRLLYMPAHRPGEPFAAVYCFGRPLDHAEVPSVDALSPRRATGRELKAPSGASLGDWHGRYRSRFLVADVLTALAPDRVRGGDGGDKVTIECPFEAEHGEPGGEGTVAMNPDACDSGDWTVTCRHNACADRSKLDHLAAMLAGQWFQESVLRDSSYLAPASDEELEAEEAERASADLLAEVRTDAAMKAYVGARFGPDSSVADIETFFDRLVAGGADEADRGRAVDALAKAAVPLGRVKLKKVGAAAAEAARRERKGTSVQEGGTLDVQRTDHPDLVARAVDALKDANGTAPTLFRHDDGLAEVRVDAEGGVALRPVDAGRIAERLNALALFHVVKGQDDEPTKIIVPTPRDVVNDVLNGDLTRFAPDLDVVLTAPFFARDGRLVAVDGYHAPTRSVLVMPDGLQLDARMADPGWTPTDEDVVAAKRLLVEEVLGDFPIGKMARDELVAAAIEGKPAPDLAHAFALLVLPFMRAMVAGPSPLHMVAKPVAGTGASLLVDVLTTLAGGVAAPAYALPTAKEETPKLLTALLREGSPFVVFDNINHRVDTGELASAVTAEVYGARILGVSRTVRTPVRSTWIATANNIVMSGELLRRCAPIGLDADRADPTRGRPSFRHDDIKAVVRERRGEFVTAALTLVRHWIAKGRPLFEGPPLASFEDWSRKVGGVVQAAGLQGFLDADYLDRFKAGASDETDDGLGRFMARLAQAAQTNLEAGTETILRPASEDAPRGVTGAPRAISIVNELNAANAQGSLIVLPGWGYSKEADGSVTYASGRHVSGKFAEVARRPWDVVVEVTTGKGATTKTQEEARVLRFKQEKEGQGGGTYWRAILAERADAPDAPA